ncbi:Retinaldehyde-binding protein 1 [Araneus ventricosus]|uniref:Retinaldehyde-binding protein 1 n=1 Tax=Araneus ventricosus TaxID=182803 RepID=A0A4Y2L4R0_ARAVE|nr:Retinaldehyde-binding protein 1 [Araneus ventricosus]
MQLRPRANIDLRSACTQLAKSPPRFKESDSCSSIPRGFSQRSSAQRILAVVHSAAANFFEERTSNLIKRYGKDFDLENNKITTGIEFEDDFLRLFLRHTKYNSSKAFPYVRHFVNFRRNYGSLFTSIPDENFATNSSTKISSVLPYRSADGCAIILSEIGKWNPDELSLEDFKRMAIFLFLQPLRCPMTQISGFKVIHDFKDTSVKYLRYCTPQNLYLFYNVALNCVPGRYKEIHCINESVLLRAVWAIVKHFLSAKMRKRVFFHSKPEDLLNHFPPFTLPAKYGGTLHDYHNTDLMRKLNKEHGNYPLGGQPNYF